MLNCKQLVVLQTNKRGHFRSVIIVLSVGMVVLLNQAGPYHRIGNFDIGITNLMQQL